MYVCMCVRLVDTIVISCSIGCAMILSKEDKERIPLADFENDIKQMASFRGPVG